jgi:hypothetical protein
MSNDSTTSTTRAKPLVAAIFEALEAAPSSRSSVYWLVVLCALVLFYKKSDSFLNPQLWAEDGAVFLIDAWNDGLHALLKPYSGSLYLFQRAAACAALLFPLRWTPHFYNYISLAATLATVAYIASRRAQLRYRGLLAFVVVAVPHGGEVFMNLTNVHWVTSLALLLLIISPSPNSIRQAGIDFVLLVVLGLTGPAVLMFSPLVLGRFLRNRSRYNGCLLALTALCCLLQVQSFNADRFPGQFKLNDSSWLSFIGSNTSGYLLLGKSLAERHADVGWMTVLTIVLFALLTFHALVQKDKKCLVILLSALLVKLATVYAYRGDPGKVTGQLAGRYTYIPLVCLTWAVIFSLGRRSRFAWAYSSVLILIGLSSMSLFPTPALVNYHWKQICRDIQRQPRVVVPINPWPWAITCFPGSDRKSMRWGFGSVETMESIPRPFHFKLVAPWLKRFFRSSGDAVIRSYLTFVSSVSGVICILTFFLLRRVRWLSRPKCSEHGVRDRAPPVTPLNFHSALERPREYGDAA